MLFYILPAATFIVVGFINLAFLNRGNWGDALGFGMIAMVAEFALVSVFAIPAFATMASNDHGVRWKTDVTGTFSVYDGSDGPRIKFPTATRGDFDMDLSHVYVYHEDINTPFLQHTCHETPDWAAPYTMGSCQDELHVPMATKFVLEVG